MNPPPLPSLQLPAGGSFTALVPELPGQPFWQALPAAGAADYADGLEELIADFNRQPPEALAAWAREHPLTSDERFILEYNTSSDRANVLRPLPLAPGDRVLEVGSGCGPVSQYLWSRAQTVSVEASLARARAAAQRLARQPNPHGSMLVSADFHQLTGAASFDWVIFNGVLEYAAIYSGAGEASPYVAMLKKAATFLKPGGRCVITIENRLGLKYFAGAPEDHYGRPAVGLEGYPTLGKPRASIRTFSRPELAELCRESGFPTAEFLFPFPDYKFTKVVVPDDPACWRFAAERMIDVSPSWRGERAYHFDEPAVFRSLAAEKLAGEFAHSFLIVAGKAGAATSAVPPHLHYYPLHRAPENAVGVVLDLVRGEARRRKLAGGLPAASALPAAASANPRARLVPPAAGAERDTLVQPVSPTPTLWEELRQHIGAATNTPEEYRAALEQELRTQLELYVSTLPFTESGGWTEFLEKLRQEFSRAGLAANAAGALGFLESQREFAQASLARLKIKPWTWWAPDWTTENLFSAADGSVRLFDVEYVDPAACLPAPALLYRQLRLLAIRTRHPSLAAHWPWPARELTLDGGSVTLPSPAAEWSAAALWPDLPAGEADRHAWFWSKAAEIVEAAMTGSVVAAFDLAYGTGPWLERLSSELGGVTNAFVTAGITRRTVEPAVVRAGGERLVSDDLAEKEQQIRQMGQQLRQKEEEINQLNTAAQERLDLVLKMDREVSRLRATLETTQHAPGDGWRAPAPAEAEAVSLQARLTETRRQLQSAQDRLEKSDREIDLLHARLNPYNKTTPLRQWLARWGDRVAKQSPRPIAILQQYAPQPMRPEKFPRPPRLAHWPRICLVTPSYQQGAFLERTMRSVLDQGYPNLAYGVQDGGSTDDSPGIITRHITRLAHAESAKDDGQSDAIRRGFAKLYPAPEDIMGWLNSDDMLMPGTLQYVGAYFARHPEVDVVYGHRVVIDEQDREVGRWFLPAHHTNSLRWFDLVPQETLFWRARCYQEVGGLDPSFQFALDWDLLLRFERACFTIRRLPYFLGCFRVHPEQKTSAKIQSIGEQEMARLRRRTHEREVPLREIQHHLDAEARRSAVVERLFRLGMRY